VFAVGTLLYSITAVMLTPFVSIYTSSITDANYNRPVFGVVMVICALVASIKLPYQYLAEGAGKFKETRTGAIVEVIINVAVSVLCVINFGVIGVLIGALCSALIRTGEYAIFTFKHLLNCSCWHLFKHALITAITFTTTYFVGKAVCFIESTNYLWWACNACLVALCSGAIVFVVSLIFYKKELFMLLNNLKQKYAK
jgi:hypothetical protein